MLKGRAVVDKMMENDAFSQWLGINVEEVKLGYCRLSMTVTPSMLNGFHIAHGGITYSLADSALAFAANSYGNQCVSIDTSIAHIQPVAEHDTLIATATEKSRTHKLGIYHVEVVNQHQKIVALFKGMVYISSKIWK